MEPPAEPPAPTAPNNLSCTASAPMYSIEPVMSGEPTPTQPTFVFPYGCLDATARLLEVRWAAIGETSAPYSPFSMAALCSFSSVFLVPRRSWYSLACLYPNRSRVPVPHARSAILSLSNTSRSQESISSGMASAAKNSAVAGCV